MEEREQHYSIEELAEQVDLPVRTIRYYISEGLLPGPGARGKAAVYGEEHLLRLRLIRLLSLQHVPLVDVRKRLMNLSTQEIRALLTEEEEHTKQLEQATPAQPEGYVAALLRRARAARETSPGYIPGTMPPEQRSLRKPPLVREAPPAPVPPMAPAMPPPTAPPAAAPESISSGEPVEADLWRRWELAPGVELHVRAESETRQRNLLERLFQAADKRYPPLQ